MIEEVLLLLTAKAIKTFLPITTYYRIDRMESTICLLTYISQYFAFPHPSLSRSRRLFIENNNDEFIDVCVYMCTY